MTNEKKVMVLVFPWECADWSLDRIDRLGAAIGVKGRVSGRSGFVFESFDEVL